MGHQHHFSQRKTPERVLVHLLNEMQRHKSIHIETPVSRLSEVRKALAKIGLTVSENYENSPYYTISIYFRWNGNAYENYNPVNDNERCRITIQWNWVHEPGMGLTERNENDKRNSKNL